MNKAIGNLIGLVVGVVYGGSILAYIVFAFLDMIGVSRGIPAILSIGHWK